MSWIEWIAAIFGLACVVWTVRQNVLSWPSGLVQVALYVFVFAEAKLYSDMILSAIYVPLQVYGWWAWLYAGPGRSTLPVTRTPCRALVGCAAVCVTGTLAVGLTMGRLTDAHFPVWDASVLVISLAATWLQACKRLESWLFWIVVDVIAIPLYAVKELWPTTALYVLFLGLAVTGYFAWRRDLARAPVAGPARTEVLA